MAPFLHTAGAEKDQQSEHVGETKGELIALPVQSKSGLLREAHSLPAR